MVLDKHPESILDLPILRDIPIFFGNMRSVPMGLPPPPPAVPAADAPPVKRSHKKKKKKVEEGGGRGVVRNGFDPAVAIQRMMEDDFGIFLDPHLNLGNARQYP